jgi:hypothetical protein
MHAIVCEEERTVLSSKLPDEAWIAIEQLVQRLEDSSRPGDLVAWKGTGYMATSRDVFAWRRSIDAIKETELSVLAESQSGEKEGAATLMRSKPIMLRVAGEITNALNHSYQNRHRIGFVQIDSTEPSGEAT